MAAVGNPRTRALTVKADGLVHHELADESVAGGETSQGNDESKGNQLDRDVLELSQTLGDGVSGLIFFRHRSPHASRGTEEHARGRAHEHAGRWPEHSESDGGIHVD